MDGEVTPDVEEDAEGERARSLPRRGHPYRALAGVAFGLAIATKWSGLLPLGAAGVLALGWELGWRKRWAGRSFASFGRVFASLGLGLVLVPFVVYALTWVPWLVNYPYSYEGGKECTVDDVVQDPCAVSPLGRVEGLVRYHRAIWHFHATLEAEHPYRAPAYTWPIMARPVVYYYETCSEDPGERAAAETTTATSWHRSPASSTARRPPRSSPSATRPCGGASSWPRVRWRPEWCDATAAPGSWRCSGAPSSSPG